MRVSPEDMAMLIRLATTTPSTFIGDMLGVEQYSTECDDMVSRFRAIAVHYGTWGDRYESWSIEASRLLIMIAADNTPGGNANEAATNTSTDA